MAQVCVFYFIYLLVQQNFAQLCIYVFMYMQSETVTFHVQVGVYAAYFRIIVVVIVCQLKEHVKRRFLSRA